MNGLPMYEGYISQLSNFRLFCLLILCSITGMTACSENASSPVDQVPFFATLALSDSVLVAGQTCSITAHTSASMVDSNWHLVWSGVLGDLIFRGKPRDSLIDFDLPAHYFQRSDLVQLNLVHSGRVIAEKQLQILPGAPVGIVESYAGNKTMVVNSGQKAMVIAVPKDTFGNPVAVGTEVAYKVRYPGAGVYTRQQFISQMISGIELEAGARTGKVIIGVSSGLARSVEETLELTPAWAVPFSLEVENWSPYADSRQNIVLQTGFIRDAAGNLVTDGTSVVFVIYENGKLVAEYQGFTSGGSARVFVENPDRQTTWEIYALVEGQVRSNALQLTFEPYVIKLPFQYDALQGAIVAGPVTANLGQMATDDLRIEIILENADSSYYLSGLTENGFCTVSLPAGMPSGWYRCQLTAGGLVVNRDIQVTQSGNH